MFIACMVCVAFNAKLEIAETSASVIEIQFEGDEIYPCDFGITDFVSHEIRIVEDKGCGIQCQPGRYIKQC